MIKLDCSSVLPKATAQSIERMEMEPGPVGVHPKDMAPDDQEVSLHAQHCSVRVPPCTMLIKRRAHPATIKKLAYAYISAYIFAVVSNLPWGRQRETYGPHERH